MTCRFLPACLLSVSLATFALAAVSASAQTAPAAPHLVEEHGRHALMVDGAPYLVLGAQINNSSSWPDVLPHVWPALKAMHVNTAEAPVYWEQIEPKPGTFDWTNVDAVLDGARAQNLHLILLWFGTWKNGNDHYVPDWVKSDPKQFPRVQNSYGTPIDVLSANSPANMEADRKAFTALMHHLAERDATQHTVLMIQVENESGNVGSARDFSPEANRQFAGAVPAELVKALGRKPGTWAEVFPGNADEAFQAWSQSRYINAIAASGKQAFNIPMYCNVWLAYPPAELPERYIATPGIGYPSGGPVQSMLSLWKVGAPSIDAVGPDMYSNNAEFYGHILDTYARKDNPMWIPETGSGDDYAPFFFSALGRGAIGFSPFGVDWTGWTYANGEVPRAHAENYALLGSMDRTIAKLNFEGALKTAVEVAGGADQEMLFSGTPAPAMEASGGKEQGALLHSPVLLANATVPVAEAGTPETRAADAAGSWVAEVRFGFPQKDGLPAPGTKDHSGRMLVAQLGPNEFLLSGIGGSVFLHRPGFLPGIHAQILHAEEGYYGPSATPGAPDEWHQTRILNGDQTDRGILFPGDTNRRGTAVAQGDHPGGEAARPPIAVRITVGRF